MDYIKVFDIELERNYYYSGERLTGWVIINNIENLKVRGVRVMLRGKAHVDWKVTRGGERRVVREDQYFVDDKTIAWGKGKHEDGEISILSRGEHRMPFNFQLPECTLPCSFESRLGTVRYYIRVIIDIPYASPPQGIKYFSIIGPHIDSMEDKYMQALSYREQYHRCCLCCRSGTVQLAATLERSAYCCGEHIKLRAQLQNESETDCWVVCRLMQHVQFRINKGVLGLIKEVHHKVFEVQGPTVAAKASQSFNDLQQHLTIPVLPPTHLDICRVLDIYYELQVCVKSPSSSEYLLMDFPLTIATLPFRVPTSGMPKLYYEHVTETAEGGQYISPEFLLGQVYDGGVSPTDDIVLYRPVYVCVKPEQTVAPENSAKAASPAARGLPSTSKTQYAWQSSVNQDNNGHVVEKTERSCSV